MSIVFTIEPRDGWQQGDRAFCVCGDRHANLEVGKIYVVESVMPVKNCVGDGLTLQGVRLPPEIRGIWSTRFVKLRDGENSLRQIDQSTTRSWIEAYAANTGQPSLLHHRRNYESQIIPQGHLSLNGQGRG